jgi:acyl carrier protein
VSEETVKSALKDWIAKKSGGKIALADLKDDTPIIEQRIISSLQVMDLILHLERLRGKPVEVESLKPGAFSTVAAIHANFFGEGA